MCAYQTSLQQGSLEHTAAEVKLLSAVGFQLSFIEMVIRAM